MFRVCLHSGGALYIKTGPQTQEASARATKTFAIKSEVRHTGLYLGDKAVRIGAF